MMKFINNLYGSSLGIDERAIYNSLILNAVINYKEDSKYFHSDYYTIKQYCPPLIYLDSKHLYFRFLEIVKNRESFKFYNPDTNEFLFESVLLEEFELGGKLVHKDLSYKYSFSNELYNFLGLESTIKYISNFLAPVENSDAKKTHFIDSMDQKDKEILLSLIQNYYPNYFDSRFELYNNHFSIKLYDIRSLSNDDTITIKELKAALSKFSVPNYWLYLFNYKIPVQCKLVEEYFVFEYGNVNNPELSYKYSLEFVTLLRDIKFISIHLSKYNVDTCNFTPL